jgi:hypothetical protein
VDGNDTALSAISRAIGRAQSVRGRLQLRQKNDRARLISMTSIYSGYTSCFTIWFAVMGVDSCYGMSIAEFPPKMCKVINWKSHQT